VLQREGRSIIKLGIGRPVFPTPDPVVEAGRKALADGHHGYTPANGIVSLREAVSADLHRRHGVTIAPDHVLVVPGGKVTMFFGIMLFGEPGAEIVYPNRGFPIYESVIRFSGATPIPMPIRESRNFSFDADEVLALITPRTRLIIIIIVIIIINSPANPTGGIVPKPELEESVAGLERYPDVAVMSDEIYGEMTYDGTHASLTVYPGLEDRLILLDGWSKTYAMTGWRLAPCSRSSTTASRRLRRWPSASLDRHCARRDAKFAGRDEETAPFGRTKKHQSPRADRNERGLFCVPIDRNAPRPAPTCSPIDCD
jgi:aspartate aminotransferase